MSKVSAVWCKRFDGSTMDGFLADIFRDRSQRACVVADFFSGMGRAVQLWNSIRYLEASCRLCKAMSDKEIGEDEGNALFRLLFAQTVRQDGCCWSLACRKRLRETPLSLREVLMGAPSCTNGHRE